MPVINLADKLARFDEHWAPRTVAEMNGQKVAVVKVLGEFVWHEHATSDDFFLVLSGRLLIADWAAALRGHRKAWLAKDKVHATAAGYLARAQLYANALASCMA